MALLFRLSVRRGFSNGTALSSSSATPASLLQPQLLLPALSASKLPFSSSSSSSASSSSSPSFTLSRKEDFWAKNRRLNRPVSPHLTIYKPQVTSLLSLSHRATGLALSAVISGFSIGMLAVPGSYPHYLELIQTMAFGPVIIFGAKFVLALPFTYHLCNGVRHLVWDLGYGFTLRTLYQTGYAVVGISLALALVAAAL
ncbi:succinate dehydrogenase cytochrome b560 subunit, mitochondrial-like isoform X1 [Penaeus indicus]|uniref:succinate dehydrogenase cytochrome b560 subunit, mitochondrial-like isoform X1 n=1 Tax=Penaeus indicus TaxID=29960 RepID=UPI00300D6E7F